MTPVGLSWAQWSLIFIPAVICALCSAVAVLGLGFVVQLGRRGQLALLPPEPPAAAAVATVDAPAVPALPRHARPTRVVARFRRPAEPEPEPGFWPAPPPLVPAGGPHDETVAIAAAVPCTICRAYVCPTCRGCACAHRPCGCFA